MIKRRRYCEREREREFVCGREKLRCTCLFFYSTGGYCKHMKLGVNETEKEIFRRYDEVLKS